MGAWGTSFTENDHVRDFLGDLEDSDETQFQVLFDLQYKYAVKELATWEKWVRTTDNTQQAELDLDEMSLFLGFIEEAILDKPDYLKILNNEQLLQSLEFLKVFAHNSNLNEWGEPNLRLKSIIKLKTHIEDLLKVTIK